MLKPKTLQKIGMHPLAPRWLKILCLRLILRYVAKGLAKHMKNITPEQRDKISASLGKFDS